MACPLKNNNPIAAEKFARTSYDLQMAEMFNPQNPQREGYHAPPWPGARTKQDEELQSKFCPTCPKEHFQYKGGVYNAPRTKFDEDLQAHWCPNCKTIK
jgi:hypothetical protein